MDDLSAAMADNSAGAGVAHAPLTCFEQALTQFDRSLGSDTWHGDTQPGSGSGSG